MKAVLGRLLKGSGTGTAVIDYRGIVRQASDVVHHRRCIACQGLGPPLCPACSAELLRVQQHPGGFWVAGQYDGALRSAILAYKRRGWLALDRPLGSLLAGAVSEHLRRSWQVLAPRAVGLVPVPSHRDSLRDRGFDAVHRLATCAVVELARQGISASVVPCLVLAREYSRSSTAGAGGRRSVAGAFAGVRARSVAGAGPVRLVVVDDVVTSGATAWEALRALIAEGIPAEGAVAIAGTQLRRDALDRHGPGSAVGAGPMGERSSGAPEPAQC